jgi:hypothetical protein
MTKHQIAYSKHIIEMQHRLFWSNVTLFCSQKLAPRLHEVYAVGAKFKTGSLAKSQADGRRSATGLIEYVMLFIVSCTGKKCRA